MKLSFDISDLEPRLTNALDKIASKTGEKGKPGHLTSQQGKAFWRGVVKPMVAKEAVLRAPSSGRKGVAIWKKGPYSYKGRHGALKLVGSVRAQPFKSATGAYYPLGGGKTELSKYVGIVGKFATWNVRRTKGGKAIKLEARPWLLDAIDVVGEKAGEKYVKLLEKVIQAEIEKGLRRR